LTHCLGVNRSRSTAMSLDTGYLDSFQHFGINAPRNSRAVYRKVITCAPVPTLNFTVGPVTSPTNETYLELNIGAEKGAGLGNIQNETFVWNIHTVDDNVEYSMR